MITIAHRCAAALFPENTLHAFKQCIKKGFTHIDLDINCTRDGHLVGHHNKCLKKPHRYPIRTLTLSRLLSYNQNITPLATYLKCLQQHPKITLMIELKTPNQAGRLLDLLEEYPLHDQLIIQSFHKQILNTLKKHHLTTALATVKSETTSHDILCPHHTLVTPDLLHRHPCIIPWTVNDPARAKSLIALGVSGLITDDPTHCFKRL